MLLPILAAAQSPPVKALSIGDTVPDITITNVYNYPASTFRLSDLKGKLVILDFWSTWCASCIEAFPKMERLQKEFNSRLQVILINVFPHDDAHKVHTFLTKRKESTGDDLSLPYSLLQSSIAPYFPFRFIPHYVWIDKNRKVIAITSQDEATAANITDALNGNVNGIHNKIDLLNFSQDKPLFVNGNGGNGDHFLYRSLLTKYIEGVGNGSGVEKDNTGKITRFFMLNTPPVQLLRAAYPDLLNCPLNRVINESGNKIMIVPDSDSRYSNSFCYDLIIPPSSLNEFQHYMQEDMERYFAVRVKGELRKMQCLIIHKSSSINEIATKGGKPGLDLNPASTHKFISNEPFSVLTDLLNNLPATKALPVIDETGISANIDLELPADLFDISLDSLKNFLRKKGLELIEKEREIKVAVITGK